MRSGADCGGTFPPKNKKKFFFRGVRYGSGIVYTVYTGLGTLIAPVYSAC